MAMISQNDIMRKLLSNQALLLQGRPLGSGALAWRLALRVGKLRLQ